MKINRQGNEDKNSEEEELCYDGTNWGYKLEFYLRPKGLQIDQKKACFLLDPANWDVSLSHFHAKLKSLSDVGKSLLLNGMHENSLYCFDY